ncbi:hypothetical protein AVEN_39995-1 [Araneus ventricosus]|uniref:Uncharacterized protein n=1 Tax=Araneus ventricosus TaxID=182803 RepID=A0A4Y2PYH1_ARAVE|nr:hypothetical protein AVEN_39995-1 [Araneus ventricosus]
MSVERSSIRCYLKSVFAARYNFLFRRPPRSNANHTNLSKTSGEYLSVSRERKRLRQLFPGAWHEGEEKWGIEYESEKISSREQGMLRELKSKHLHWDKPRIAGAALPS